MRLRLAAVMAGVAGLLLPVPAGAQGIRTERLPPFDTASACVAVPLLGDRGTGCEREVPAVAPLVHAEVSGLAWARGSLAHPCPWCACPCPPVGWEAAAGVGIVFVVPAGRHLEVEAEVETVDAAGADLCLQAGPARSCVSPQPAGRLLLRASLDAPPDQTLVADPTVALLVPDRRARPFPQGMARAGAATIRVRRFAYTLT